ncbi:MAG: YebC/PmpR family DNA-binding transcriptional regulator [Planctomycetota bacterium]|nr:MAG: YebC/PmpR family DNA-binding transcriptional regulator [Planctomycetota bacterium]
MAGHSHWANIKHKKAANDAKKAKVITQMGRLIRGAIQVGGPSPDENPRLRLAIQKAKAQNMTNDVIDRILAKAKGEGDSKPMEELTYEGYASNGVAVVVEVMSDNRNRTAPEIRKLFERGGGAMGAPGCVAWQFHEKALFAVDGSDEESVLEALLAADADAEDIAEQEGQVLITAPANLYDVVNRALSEAGLSIASADISKIPENEVHIDDLETAQKIQRLIDTLDEHDDVTAVYSNFVPSADIAEEL